MGRTQTLESVVGRGKVQTPVRVKAAEWYMYPDGKCYWGMNTPRFGYFGVRISRENAIRLNLLKSLYGFDKFTKKFSEWIGDFVSFPKNSFSN